MEDGRIPEDLLYGELALGKTHSLDVGMQTWTAECGRRQTGVTPRATVGLFGDSQSDDLLRSPQTILTESATKQRKYPASGSCLGDNVVEVKGQRSDWLQTIQRRTNLEAERAYMHTATT